MEPRLARRIFWLQGLAQWLLFERAKVPQRQAMILTLRTATQVGCPF
jgi:hypothetical protein